jgi:molybdenum cofactor synthesis domain-containing protein
MEPPRIAVLTVSDRGAIGERTDTSGPAIEELVLAGGFRMDARALVPDSEEEIRDCLRRWADGGAIDVVITTGGTGFAPRDVTPEATRAVIDREAQGLAEALRTASLQKTPYAALSRGVAGIRGRTLIVNLPGSEKAVRENMEALLPLLPHAVAMLREGGDHG